MKIKTNKLLLVLLLLSSYSNAHAETDSRIYVEMPEKMKEHQLANMRDHLQSINEILLNMGKGDLTKAADIAETRLGMSSLSRHGAAHMAQVIPKGMSKIGISMHKAASNFALKAEEGDLLPAYKALQKVTSACVSCHAAYKTHKSTKTISDTMPSVSPSTEKTTIDKRINLGLTPSEKGAFLSEMRQMLKSIQGVVSGIGSNNPEKIIEAAHYSGNRMARATPDSIKKKTPDAFKQIGGPTHMMFEELVVRAETDDMESLTQLTGKLMQQCITCHAMFKVSD